MRHMEITMVEVVKSERGPTEGKREAERTLYRRNARSIAHQSSALLLAPSTAPNRENASQKTAATPSTIGMKCLENFR